MPPPQPGTLQKSSNHSVGAWDVGAVDDLAPDDHDVEHAPLKLPWLAFDMRLKIANGLVVTAAGQQRTDILCRDGSIEQLGSVDQHLADEQIARGRLVRAHHRD